MHAHSCLRRHSIPHHQWRIQDFSEGGASRSGPIFALELLKFLKSLIINCKARAIPRKFLFYFLFYLQVSRDNS